MPRGRAAGRPRMKMHSNNRRRSRAIAGKRAVKGGTRLDIVDAWFGFCHERVPGKGEDSWCHAFNERAGLIGVFDGCGGLGAACYEKAGGHTGAYLASRTSAEATLEWFEGYCEGEPGDVEHLKERLSAALSACAEAVGAGASGLMGSMVRRLPTTAALWRFEKGPDGRLEALCAFAGDSRAYLLDDRGLTQVSVDDIAGEDAMSNLCNDAAMSNVISADGRFTLGEARVRPVGPCVLLCATDGCFGYLKSPMEFEHLLLSTLEASKSIDAWQEKLERVLDEIAGDDQSLAAVVIGYGSFAGLRRAMKPRLEALETMVAGFGDSYEARLAAWEREKAAYYRLAGGGAPKKK